ncbi:MAG: ABC transporter ATP-binding protein, partial [Yoonia sp.]
EYVRKFTEDIDKARVVHAGVLAKPDAKGTGDPVDAGATIKELASLLVHDPREVIPVKQDGSIIGGLNRQDGLTVLLEAG